MAEQSSHEINDEVTKLENEITEMDTRLAIVQNEYSEIRMDILKLKRDIKDKEITQTGLKRSIDTQKEPINRKRVQLEQSKRAYFRTYREGR